MKANQIKEVRAELMGGQLTYSRGIELRAKLEAQAEANYHAKNPPGKILAFINKWGNGLQLKKVHPTDRACPWVWQLFTPHTQWVCGDSIAECFDKALVVKADWTHVSTTDVAKLVLAHQAIKDAKREDTVQVAESVA